MPADDGPDRGVLFDLDGTLVDTPYLHAVCWTEALRQSGHDVPMATVHRAIGMGGAELLDHLLGAGRDRAGDDTMDAAHLALYQQHWGRLRPLPGAVELLRWCRDRGLDTVLASSASATELAELRATLDADDAVSTATGADDAGAGKPAPDILRVALDRTGLAPERAVFVGDSVWDGQAAGRAGVAFVAVTCGGTSAAELRESGAVEVWHDPADLLAGIDGSALGKLAMR